MNLEEFYSILIGASNSRGAKYDVVQRWFTECGIIDGRFIQESLFTKSYERICPNHEVMSLVQFVQLLGILARETRQDVSDFEKKFRAVKQVVLDEIQERIRNEYV